MTGPTPPPVPPTPTPPLGGLDVSGTPAGLAPPPPRPRRWVPSRCRAPPRSCPPSSRRSSPTPPATSPASSSSARRGPLPAARAGRRWPGNTENVGGVRVELDRDTATIGLDVEIEYGVGARELTRALRRHVPEAVEQIAGVQVTELNIVITDVPLPGNEPGPVPPPPPSAPSATL